MIIHYYSKQNPDIFCDHQMTLADWEIEDHLLTQPEVEHTYNYLVVIVAKTLHLEKKIQLNSVIIDGVEYEFVDNVLRNEPDCIWDVMLKRNVNVRYPNTFN
jgi:hypothetical protein